MDFTIPAELQMLKDLARRFVDEELIPLEREVIEAEMARGLDVEPFQPKPGEHYIFDPDGVLPRATYERLMARARDLGLFGLDVPAELGGAGVGALGKVLVMEEMGRTLVPFILPPDAPNLHWMLACCTPDQRERYLIPYAGGERSACLAVTEPNAGSDAAAIQTTAVKRGDRWVLNGRKMFINRADWSDFMIVLAVTDREKRARGGVTAFLVDRGTPGVTITRRIATMIPERPCEIVFEDVELGEEQVLGKVGWAFPELQNRFGIRRVEIGTRCVGAAERLLGLLTGHVTNRSTFGERLADRQAIQWWVADAVTDLHATRLMTYHAAWKLDHGIRDIRYEASMVKVFATEMVTRVADRCLQAHGGLGIAKELPVEFFYRLVRYWRIVEGPTEVHRMVLARNRLNGRVPSLADAAWDTARN